MAKLSLFERRRRRVRTALKSRAGGKARLSVLARGPEAWFVWRRTVFPDFLLRRIVTPEVTIDKEGMWTAKCVLRNYKDETMWDVSRQFWSMVEGSSPPDP